MTPARLRTGFQNYLTPLDLAQEVRGVLGGQINLDPCTDAANRLRATKFYVPPGTACVPKDQWDGLMQPWEDGTWCNPPYTDIAHWSLKLLGESSKGHRIGLLTSVTRTEHAWFQHVIRHSSCYQFLEGKLCHTDRPAMIASWVFWFNVSPEVVDREMGWRGVISVPW